MAFDEVRFPEDISYGSSGGANFNTTVLILSSGHEQRNVNWSDVKSEFDVGFGIKDISQMDEIIAFFYARQGRARGFRYKDWADYKITNQSIGIGDGVTTIFQIYKRYTSGLINYDRTITKIVSGSVAFTVDGNVPDSNTVDLNLGTITFNTAPSIGEDIFITSLEFDVPVRFDTDKIDISQDFFQTQTWSSIPLVEVRI